MAFDLKNLPLGFHEDPYPHYEKLREETPILEQSDGPFVLSRWADLDRIYRDTQTYISDKKQVFKPKFGDSPLFEHHTTSLVFNDPPLHTQVRSIMVGAMNPRAIAGMEAGLIARVDELLDRLKDQQTPDLIESFAGAIPIEVIGNLFDMPKEERGPLRDWSLAILGALEPTVSPENMARGNAAVLDFRAYLRDLVARRKRAPGDPDTDVLTRLIFADDGALSETQLLENCIFILNAGHETTTNLIGNGLALLDRDRGARQRLLTDPERVAGAVDEVLRLESPNQFGNRLTTQAVEIAGVSIPEGRDLHLCIGAANRDPRKFENPDQMQENRRPNKHLAFAGGPHTCVGLSLARMEGRVAIARFLERFPSYALAGGAQRGERIRFRGYAKLPADLRG